MDEIITYHEFKKIDLERLVHMGLKLWNDSEETELRKQLIPTQTSDKQKIYMAKKADNTAIGFSFFSIRSEYVEGSKQSPTGYLEGIFVEKDYRNIGIAKKFLQMGEHWLKLNNCVQIGSDTWLSNKDSREFHKKIGFKEEEKLVHFIKDIK